VKSSRHQALVVILVLVLVLGWLFLEGAERPNPIREGLSHLLSPLQLVIKRASQPFAQAFSRVQRLGELQREFDRLVQENAILRSQVVLLEEASIENETLRGQLEFRSAVPEFQLLSAEVIGHDPNKLLHYLIIDRGSADGIKRGMPVLTAAGLVGRISEISGSSSKVLLVTDSSSSVSALVQRSRATGVVQGYVGQELRMRYIPQGETVEPGDMVLSSGLGGNFPKRLVIGQIERVSSQDVDMFQEAKVVPAVNLRGLETVMVLLNFVPSEPAGESSRE
jgi:rod shape-determining protein MreC